MGRYWHQASSNQICSVFGTYTALGGPNHALIQLPLSPPLFDDHKSLSDNHAWLMEAWPSPSVPKHNLPTLIWEYSLSMV